MAGKKGERERGASEFIFRVKKEDEDGQRKSASREELSEKRGENEEKTFVHKQRQGEEE